MDGINRNEEPSRHHTLINCGKCLVFSSDRYVRIAQTEISGSLLTSWSKAHFCDRNYVCLLLDGVSIRLGLHTDTFSHTFICVDWDTYLHPYRPVHTEDVRSLGLQVVLVSNIPWRQVYRVTFTSCNGPGVLFNDVSQLDGKRHTSVCSVPSLRGAFGNV